MTGVTRSGAHVSHSHLTSARATVFLGWRKARESRSTGRRRRCHLDFSGRTPSARSFRPMRILLMPDLVPLLIAFSNGPDEVVPVSQAQAHVDDASGTPANADADDPAIWVHPRSARQSVVLGTLKEGGLAAFDLAGRTLGTYPAPVPPTPEAKPGRVNNVDVLGRVPVGGRSRGLACVRARGRDRVQIGSAWWRGRRGDGR